MAQDFDEEARNITISLLDFFQQNTIDRLRKFVWGRTERVSLESPLKSLIRYRYSIDFIIENLLRSMGKDSYTVSKDLIIIDEIMSLL